MSFDHRLELPALLRSWRERGSAFVLRDCLPVSEGMDTDPPQRPLPVASPGLSGAEELPQKVDEGRRVLLDLDGEQIAVIPNEVTCDVRASKDDEHGEWKEGDKGQGCFHHDRPTMAIVWPSGVTTVTAWPDPQSRFVLIVSP